MQFKLIVLLTALVAASFNGTVRSESCVCAGRSYTAADTRAAINQGRTGRRSRNRSSYPHKFRSFDAAIDFYNRCTPPFLVEFPLIAGGVYAGGGAGPDRVVYDLSGDFCGCITHTGTASNGFVHC